MMNDNTTPIAAKEYDQKINHTIPYYSEFYNQTLDIVEQCNFQQINWLDLGCGTGSLEERAFQKFPIQLLKDVGFCKVQVFWYSYMQMGIYGIK